MAACTFLQVLTTVRASLGAEVASQSGLWDRLLRLRPDFLRRFSSGDLETRTNVVGEMSRSEQGDGADVEAGHVPSIVARRAARGQDDSRKRASRRSLAAMPTLETIERRDSVFPDVEPERWATTQK